jgi:ribosome-binding protein aMBF1 (putative translation factor)
VIHIDNVDDLLKVIEARRVEMGISERQLSEKIGKSPSIYWWWKKKGKCTKVSTALEYMKVLDLKLSVS